MKLLISGGGGGGEALPNKGRYGCAASEKPKPGKKSAQRPNDGASFHDFSSAKLENFQQVGHFFTLIKYYTFVVKNCQKPNA